MELEKHPETETEYWEAIESLGGYIWRGRHDLFSGSIEDPNGDIWESIKNAAQLQKQLVYEIGQKFGVIYPNDYPRVGIEQPLPTLPTGKISYKDWHTKTKIKYYRKIYDSIICSACPLSQGLQRMIDLGGSIPCEITFMTRPSDPSLCGLLEKGSWTREKLVKEIIKKSGENAENVLDTFLEKERDLKKDKNFETVL